MTPARRLVLLWLAGVIALQVGRESLFGPPEPLTEEFARGAGLLWIALLLVAAGGYLWSPKSKAFLAAMPADTRRLYQWLQLGFFVSMIAHLVWMVASGDSSRGPLVFIGIGCLIVSMILASDVNATTPATARRAWFGRAALATFGGMLLYQGASALRAAPRAALISGASFAVGLLCFYELLRSDSVTKLPERAARRRVAWDVRLVSYLVLVTCLLDGLDMLKLSLFGIPGSVRAGDIEQLAVMLIMIGRYVVDACAAWQLPAMRPWARLWLALLALVSVVLWAPGIGQIMQQLGTLSRGGLEAFGAARWLAHHIFPIVTLVVLARPREDFPPLAPRARRSVIAGVVLLLMFGQFQKWWHPRPAFERQPPPRVAQDAPTAQPEQESALVPGEATLTLRPTFRGRLLDGVPRDRVSFTLEASDVTKVQNGPQGTTEAYTPRGPLDQPWTFRDGLIEVPRLPAAFYEVKVTIRGDAARGDLVGTAASLFRAANGPATIDVRLIESIRLFAPPFGVPVSSPVTVAWRPVAGADFYFAHLVPVDVDGGNAREIVATVKEARWVVEVPPGKWTLILDAIAGEDHETIALLFPERTVVVEPRVP